MEKQIKELIGKTGSVVEGVKYVVLLDAHNIKWLYLVARGIELENKLLIGLVSKDNKRGITAIAHYFTGKPVKFTIDRQYFNFIED